MPGNAYAEVQNGIFLRASLRSLRLPAVAGLCVCLLFSAAPVRAQEVPQASPAPAVEKPTLEQLMQEGVQEFKRNNLPAAIILFQNATEADPTSVRARVYLATAYAHTYIPGDSKEENVARGRQAIAEYRSALELDSTNLGALDGVGALLFHMALQPFDRQKLMEARSFHYRHTQIKPEDAEPHYWLGLIDWTIVYHANLALRTDYNQTANPALAPADPLPEPLVSQFRDQYGWLVDDGITHLKKAVAIRATYADAWGYLFLLYRQKADQCASPDERAGYIQLSDELVARIKELKMAKPGAPASP